MRIAITSRKSVIVACTPVTVVFRSSVMSLIITFMFEPAKLQMNCASASGARNLRAETGDRADGGFPLICSPVRPPLDCGPSLRVAAHPIRVMRSQGRVPYRRTNERCGRARSTEAGGGWPAAARARGGDVRARRRYVADEC